MSGSEGDLTPADFGVGSPPEARAGSPPLLLVNPADHDAQLVQDVLEAIRDVDDLDLFVEYNSRHERAYTIGRFAGGSA